MKHPSPLAPALLALLCACATTPSGPPDELARQIVADLDAGERGAAVERYARVAKDEDYRQRIYPVVYDEASRRYDAGEGAGAARLLGFLTEAYPESPAAHHARVLALFLARAQRAEPDPALSAELGEALGELWRLQPEVPPIANLAATQQRIDEGRLDDARVIFARFLSDWSGEPPELLTYVEDIDRYLESQR